jgi:hypothetical protein
MNNIYKQVRKSPTSPTKPTGQAELFPLKRRARKPKGQEFREQVQAVIEAFMPKDRQQKERGRRK